MTLGIFQVPRFAVYSLFTIKGSSNTSFDIFFVFNPQIFVVLQKISTAVEKIAYAWIFDTGIIEVI